MKKLALPRSWTWKTWSSCLVPTGNASSPTFKVSIAASSWRTKNLSSSHKDLSATPQSYWIIIKYHSPIWVLSLSHSLPTLFGSFNLIYFIDAFNSHFLLFWLFGRFFLFFEKEEICNFSMSAPISFWFTDPQNTISIVSCTFLFTNEYITTNQWTITREHCHHSTNTDHTKLYHKSHFFQRFGLLNFMT